jgi:hypothetical protein
MQIDCMKDSVQVLELEEDNPKEAFAFHQGEAFEYLASGKTDELLERILQGESPFWKQKRCAVCSFGFSNQ